MSKLHWEDLSSVIEPQINAAGTHIWPFNPSFPIDVRLFTLDGFDQLRMNRHDYFELYYVSSGRGQFQVQDRSLPINEGDLVVMGSNLYHRVSSHSRRKMKAVALYFQPEVIRASETNGDDVEYLMPFLLQESGFPHVISSKDSDIPAESLQLIQRIRATLPASSARARLTVRTCVKMILMLLVNHYAAYCDTREIFNRREETLKRLQPLFEFLEHHYDQPITIKMAAASCAMSLSHFMRFFKQMTGQSFHDYLNHFRIAKAQVLLAATDKSISEISQEVGFCDQSYFGTVFRKIVNLTPAAYRRHSSIETRQSGLIAATVSNPNARSSQLRPVDVESPAGTFQSAVSGRKR